MGEQAVALAEAVGHDLAGTVEFVAVAGPQLLLPGDEHRACRLNIRVTELITGVDLRRDR